MPRIIATPAPATTPPSGTISTLSSETVPAPSPATIASIASKFSRTPLPIRFRYIDTHAHLRPGSLNERGFHEAAQTAVSIMDMLEVAKTLVMPPPHDRPRADYDILAEVVNRHPEKLAFLGGGGILNPMIQVSVQTGIITPEDRKLFEERALLILRNGAVGFGELTAEHLSLADWHPYVSAPPDHPLFLLLADIAARHDVPINLHMEAVLYEMPLPARFARLSPNNPAFLRENITGLERLLSHNSMARIVWAHVGWDNTGHMTTGLLYRLLSAHSNLYMGITMHDRPQQNQPLNAAGKIEPDWVKLISFFPDRFVIQTDIFYPSSQVMIIGSRFNPRLHQLAKSLLDQLPDAIARKVAYENALKIYRLK